MALPDRSQSYWIASTPETAYPTLAGDVTVDVAIVGGGIVGLTAAYLLRREGVRVAVIEAHRIASDVTGHTTAKLTALHECKYADLIRSFDRERARLYADANSSSIRFVGELCAEHGIECEYRTMPAYTYTHSEDQVERLHAEAEALRSLGLPGAFTTDVPLPFQTLGAVVLPDQAIFHPLKFLLALARHLPGDGSHILERTRAVDVERGRPMRVRTATGTVSADHVIVATHYPFLDRGLYFARLEVRRSYVIAVRTGEPHPEGILISTYPDFHSIRPHPTADGWLVLIGGHHHTPGEVTETLAYYEELEAYARGHFTVESVDYRWSTQDNWTLDGLPYVGSYVPGSPRLYVATGFAGWGMTNGIAAARILANAILGRPNPWAAAFDPARVGQIKGVGKSLRMGISAVDHLVRDRLTRQEEIDPAQIARGEGRVGMLNGRQVAISRDDENRLHAVSPACGHQSCIVAWNEAERSWDCPCHGSRYSPDGTFIHGPTVKDLEPRELPEGEGGE